jgi:Xaa-Pro dipeptidase
VTAPALDRRRTAALLGSLGLDGLLAASPEHVLYATGYRPWVIGLYRRAGYGGVVIPADPARPAGILVPDVEAELFRRVAGDAVPTVHTYSFWVAYADITRVTPADDPLGALRAASAGQPGTRAGQVDREATTAALARLVRDLGLGERTRLGLEGPFTGADVWGWLRRELPTVELVDASAAFAELRMIKSAREIEHLRLATALTEVGIAAAVEDGVLGKRASDVVHRFQRAVLADPRVDAEGLEVGTQRLSLRAGPHVLAPEAYSSHRIAPGDILFLDAGVELSGYRADMGRTAVCADPPPAAGRIYEALRRGQDAVRPLLRPGTPVAELFEAGLRAVRAAGLSDYVRGNVGHGIGLDPQPELPIVSRADRHTLAPDMVISIEFPYYIHGLGAFQIESTYHITATGAERWDHLPDELIRVGADRGRSLRAP